MNTEKLRWQYRFDNYKRAFFLLQEASQKEQQGELDQLGKEGMIQRFEYCMELAWKTIKDYLESQNVVLKQLTPRTVLKEAVAAKLITQGTAWMQALDDRNRMSHTYNFKDFEEVIRSINQSYLMCFSELYETLSAKYLEISQ